MLDDVQPLGAQAEGSHSICQLVLTGEHFHKVKELMGIGAVTA